MPASAIGGTIVEMLQRVQATILIREGELAMAAHAIPYFRQQTEVERSARLGVERRGDTRSQEEPPGEAPVPAGRHGDRHHELGQCLVLVGRRHVEGRPIFVRLHLLESEGEVEVVKERAPGQKAEAITDEAIQLVIVPVVPIRSRIESIGLRPVLYREARSLFD